MSLQASTYIEGDSRHLHEWLLDALAAVRRDFPEIASYKVDLVDDGEVSLTLKLTTSSFGVAEDIAEHVIQRLEEIGSSRREKHFQTGQTELLPA